MTVSLSQDAANLNHRGSSAPELGIALLIDLAKQGEINPWDVQVIEVIDRFLSELAPVREAGQLEREVALSQSGQAFLYASMLVLLKADSLARSSEPEDEAELLEDGTELLEDDTAQRGPLKLERQLRRRAVAQPPQKRRVTLQELIDQLQLMATAMEDRPRRARPKKSSPKSSAQVARAITHLAHQENLSEVAGILERFFLQHWTQIAQEHEWLELDELLECLSSATKQAAGESPVPADTSQALKENDRVGVFWALLLLSAQSKVELSQEEFYQDLKIRALPESLQLPAAKVDESIKPAS
ncbi:ScpA family protein [Microcoleus sp. FACHB-68]|uniref:segregation/condensation protein A n=1 Tax=Microcoleus sp. FACHB-68 TaxID=2692826 RepID=UPI0016881D28|nr:ScpA family protein [Microcoleus sp. FACHB-68]MBD1939862.1 segregation/condensation protein A [Microcoleus sp. FACHB-68]